MYIVMTKPLKQERVNIRLEEDIKQDAKILAEMHRWDLTTLIKTLLDEGIKEAKEKMSPAFEDAAKRLESAEKAAKRRPRTSRPVVSVRGDSKRGKRRLSNGG